MVSKFSLLTGAAIAAFLVTLLTADKASAYHQNGYQMIMTPPTHPAGIASYNSCGWHTGSCLNNDDGSALDWGYWNGSSADYDVRFRGWFYRSNTSYSSNYLWLRVTNVTVSENLCDKSKAGVLEFLPWEIRWEMHYLHTNRSVGGAGLYVSGSGVGAWNDPTVAHMVYDYVGCPWTAYHVHEWLVPVGTLSVNEQNRGVYPCCNYGGGNFANNIQGYYTHRVQFWQGH
jgi:hypothetical protein